MLESAPKQHKSIATREGLENLNEFPKPKEEALAGKANEFAQTYNRLFSEKMFSRFLNAVTEKEIYGSTDRLSQIQNMLVEECLDLSYSEIDIILNSFNRSIRKWFLEKHSQSEVDSRVYQSMISGKYTQEDRIRGVRNAILFLKNRGQFLNAEPKQNYSFYWSSKLDSRYSIDVIEEIGNDENPEISLIQLKSSRPSKEEIDSIHAEHEKWAMETWLDIKEYEESYIGEGAKEEIEKFLKNKETMEESLLDFCTNPNGQDLQNLLDSLHLSNLAHRQQAWIFWKYSELLEEQLKVAERDGILDEETTRSILDKISNLKNKLESKIKLPKSQTLVNNIKSIISVGAYIISEREIDVEGKAKVLNTH